MDNKLLSIPHLFEQVVLQNTHKTAIICNGKTLSYNDVNQKANQLAHLLIGRYGLKRGSVIAVFDDSSEWTIISMLAILKIGCIYLPLDSKYPEERIKFNINDAQILLIIVGSSYFKRIDFVSIPRLIIENLEDAISEFSTDNPQVDSTPDDAAYIMYTSGTTGNPNGVLIPQKGIIRLVNSDFLPFDSNLTFLQLAPLGFDASTFEIWGALLHANKLVVYAHHSTEFSEISRLIHTYKINCIWLTASFFNRLIDEDATILNGVTYILTGGEALSVSHIKKAQNLLKDSTFINGYGPTECTTFTCCYTIPDLQNVELNSIPIGKPIAKTSVHLLDKKMEPVKEGEIGELYVGGEGLAIEYLNNKTLTDQRFITYRLPDNKEIRLYKTGDLCRRNEDGNYDFVSRVDHQVKINGFRIETAEIEICLKKHNLIADAVVLMKQTNTTKKIVAYVVSKNSTQKATHAEISCTIENTIDKNELNKFIAKWLPSYMIPSKTVEVSKIPINVNGKIDREALNKLETAADLNRKVEHLVGVEEDIRVLCESILLIKIDHVNDNFIQLGGESLSIAQLLYHLSQTYQVDIPINYFYNEPTLSTIFKFFDHPDTDQIKLIEQRINLVNESFSNLQTIDVTASDSVDALIKIRSGKGNPLFIAPGMGGNAFSFIDFANKIYTDQPIYVFQYPFNKEGRFLTESIAELAVLFTRNIRKIQPRGDYQLLGYSFGGRLVFEIAHLLELDHENVSFLGLIDSEHIDKERLMHKHRLRYEMKIFKMLSFRLKIKYLNKRILATVINFIKARVTPSSRAKHIQYMADNELRLEFFKIWRTFDPDYNVNCDVYLFKAMNEDPLTIVYYIKQLFPDLYISNNLNGKLHITEIICSHTDLFNMPRLNILTAKINQIISQKSNI